MSSSLIVLTAGWIPHMALMLRLLIIFDRPYSPITRIGMWIGWTHKPTLFFWIALGTLLSTDYVLPWLAFGSRRMTAEVLGCLLASVLLFLDWWWGGPGRRQRRRAAQTVLKVRQVLAYGVRAKRPSPTPA